MYIYALANIFIQKKELFKVRTSEKKTKQTQRIIIETENAGDVSKETKYNQKDVKNQNVLNFSIIKCQNKNNSW